MTIENLLYKGYKIELIPLLKRVTNSEGYREWDVRYCWKIINDSDVTESRWEGFTSPTECLDDMINRS